MKNERRTQARTEGERKKERERKKRQNVPHTRALKRLMIEKKKTNEDKTNKVALLLHMCSICTCKREEETEGYLFVGLSVNTKIENGKEEG